jgi:hypothetical protein
MIGCEPNMTPLMAKPSAKCMVFGLTGSAAELFSGITNQRVYGDVFDCLTVVLVFPVHASAPEGLANMDLVGGPIASSAKALQRFLPAFLAVG